MRPLGSNARRAIICIAPGSKPGVHKMWVTTLKGLNKILYMFHPVRVGLVIYVTPSLLAGTTHI